MLSLLYIRVKAQQYFERFSYKFWNKKTWLRLNPRLNLIIFQRTGPSCLHFDFQTSNNACTFCSCLQRRELTERAWEKAAQGLGKNLFELDDIQSTGEVRMCWRSGSQQKIKAIIQQRLLYKSISVEVLTAKYYN